jgi:hypothetical protein
MDRDMVYMRKQGSYTLVYQYPRPLPFEISEEEVKGFIGSDLVGSRYKNPATAFFAETGKARTRQVWNLIRYTGNGKPVVILLKGEKYEEVPYLLPNWAEKYC